MKKAVIVFFMGILLLYMNKADAEEIYDWNELNQIANNALQFTKQERFDEAEQLLLYFAEQFSNIPEQQNDISSEHVKAIKATHHQTMKAMQKEEVNLEEKVRAVTQFRLVVDAAVSEHQPLWSSMETSIMETFSQMKTDVEAGNEKSFQHDWNRFISLYNIIYPSIQVDVDAKRVKKVDTHISVVEDQLFEQIPHTSRIKQLSDMETELKALFERVEEDEADPSLLWVMITTGGMIILALSYAAWRKYKGEKQKHPHREADE
ncbi:sporulation protein YpjB [Metabacillus fastidiosus]|uniref:sporulation protein YpjB n=1 Tax=Metabacillus fastidiosus TaxID=1458 RepID=UPI002DB7D5E0|nr:sporulation protein YpjB [Metabacillus fastidiosus]MEC2077448.1 sporulation protein YpjB [Metabacillus fastidiosus]